MLRGSLLKRILALSLIWVALGFSVVPAAAQDDAMDDVLAGFDESDEFEVDPAQSEPSAAMEDRVWSLQGDLNFGLTASLHNHDSPTGDDYSGLQRFRTKLALQFDLDLPRGWKLRTSGYGFYDLAYEMNGRRGYTREVKNTYENDFEVTDTYFEGSLHERVDLKIGRQVVNWGRSESLRVLDIINPLDSREPGLVDIEDIRRSVGMAKLGVFWGPWTLTLLAIPEVRYGISPARGSDQAPDVGIDVIIALNATLTPAEMLRFMSITGNAEALSDERIEKDFGKATEFAVNLTGVFSGWDVSLQAARYNDDRAHFDPGDGQLEHSRLWMLGSGANYTFGSWLIKSEIAYLDGFEFFWADEKKSRVDTMIGVEYYGISDVNIVLEIAQRHINGFESAMGRLPDFAQKDTLETALRISVDLMNDQLHLTMLSFVIGEAAQDGSFVRLSAAYDVIDALSVNAGFLLFQSGDNIFFANSEKNDRFFAGAKYSF
ncbi:MAG: DUF1302 family protein [Myxococcales bacterium]|nr:DUF1302 family protein [Myxococcales bacterium]